MSAGTSIEWTGSTWTPIRARNRKTGKLGHHCEHVSEGCRNCYADRQNRWIGTGFHYKPTHRADVELFLDEKVLTLPLRWKEPRKVFVCSMTDLFADFVPDEWILAVFTLMATASRHTFQVLTKRPERMLRFARKQQEAWARVVCGGPLENVWLGVSVEDQATADERIPLLLRTPAAVRFISLEPQLAPVDLEPFLWLWDDGGPEPVRPRLDWVIQGGESGPSARPFAREWAETGRAQCAAAGVPYFLKQMGRWILGDDAGFRVDRWLCNDLLQGQFVRVPGSRDRSRPANAVGFSLGDRKGGDMEEWSPDLRVRDFPKEARP